MTEQEYVLACFDKHFSEFRDKNIVIHGSRSYAEAIIENYGRSYNFVGVMSLDTLDRGTWSGLQVFDEEDLQSGRIDMVILTERVKYAERAYQSIQDTCKKNEILLYNMYGVDEIRAHRELLNCFPLNCPEWQKLCSGYQIVAFEAMDTLIKTPDLIIRECLKELIVSLNKSGIEVFISLRKSFSAEKQIEILQEANLFDDIHSHLIYRSGEDLSFRKLREDDPDKKILYVGTGIVNEYLLPRCYGIDTYRFTDLYSDFGMPVPEIKKIPKKYDRDRKNSILRSIRESDVVSFDVFDTLLVRRTLLPEDVFRLTEMRAKTAGISSDCFAKIRKNTEQYAGFSTIFEIYETIREYYGWSEATTKTMLEMELAVEDDVLIPRTEIVQLMEFAFSIGKKVVLTSDMYLPEPVLRSMLERKGIKAFSKIFVSCDYKCAKTSGLFKEVCRLAEKPEKILHIGDNVMKDCEAAASYGIRTEHLASALSLAADNGWATCIQTPDTLMERCLLGMTIAELFRDPFRNPNLSEVTINERLKRFAEGVVGPLVSGYITWLMEKIHEKKYDGVLFLARDGYLPMKVYQELDKKSLLPPAVYYYANRHSTFLCCSDDVQRIEEIVDRGKVFDLNSGEILKRIYDLSESEILPEVEGESTADRILRHMPIIKKKAQKAREAYLLYSKQCGIKENGHYAVVDFFSVGTTQRNLEYFLPAQLKGLYFGNYSAEETAADVDYYLAAGNKSIIRNYIELESFFISPEPSLCSIEEDGSALFDHEIRTEKELSEFDMVLSLSLAFAKEFFKEFYTDGESVRPGLTEKMFAAEGYHGVQRFAYDDWCKEHIREKIWLNAN